jgi:ceramide glucosyltransferase
MANLLTLGLWLVTTLILVWGTWIALRRFKSVPPHLDAPFGLFPVSILKPLKGADPGLEENLRSFFLIDYPDYELLFSVEDPKDPAVAVVHRLLAEFPSAKAQLIVGGLELGPNPKINNLAFSYGRARHDWILISDSNIRVQSWYLKRMMAHVDSSVGLITAVVAGQGAQGLGGHLEAMALNTFYARGMNIAAGSGKPAALGKSMLFRRSVAQRFGGMGTLARFLAEDYMAGEAMRRLGLQVVLMSDPITQHIGDHSLEAFWQRHVRWGRIRKAQVPLAFYAEVLTLLPITSIFAVLALPAWTSLTGAQALFLHLSLHSLCDFLLLKRLSDSVNPLLPVIWLIRETLSLPLWFCMACGNTVNWRGQKLTLEPGGTLAVKKGHARIPLGRGH